MTRVDSDWRPGSPIFWETNTGGRVYTRKGKVLEADRGRFLKFTDFNPDVDSENSESNHAIITYQLSEKDGRKILHMTDDCAGDEKKYNGSDKFWDAILPKLKEMLENNC